MGGRGVSSGGQTTGAGAQSKSSGQLALNENRLVWNIRSRAGEPLRVSRYSEKSPSTAARRVSSGRPSASVPQSAVSSIAATGMAGMLSPPVIVAARAGSATVTALRKWT